MRAVKQGLLWALAGWVSSAAAAGTVHKVRFAQPAQILVWEDGELIAQGPRVQLLGLASTDREQLIGDGTLLPVETARGTKTISVASNAAFSLRSQEAGASDRYAIRVLSARENAEARVQTGTEAVFRQGAKTAIRPGAPASQAIELEISWSGDAPPDLFIVAD